MQTIGWVFILIGFIVIRQASRGRPIGNIPSDIGDILRGAATSLQSPSAGSDIIKAVLARQGTNIGQINATVGSMGGSGLSGAGGGGGGAGGGGGTSWFYGDGNGKGTQVLAAMHTLAAAANNTYKWGAAGPSAYDCSGLVWAAMKNTGVYTGLRFTTYTFVMQMSGRIAKVDNPSVGDVVLWPSHIGVVDGAGTMYSALNPTDGIKSSPLSWGPKNEGNPTYWRLV